MSSSTLPQHLSAIGRHCFSAASLKSDSEFKAMKVKLDSKSIEQYWLDGFVQRTGKVFGETSFARLKHEFEQMLIRLPDGERPEYMDTPHFANHRLLEWALAPEVLDLVEPILGEDILLFSTHFICKPPKIGLRFSWHQDYVYWLSMLDSIEVVTVWLAIDSASAQNGGMFFIPRKHTRDACEHADPHLAAQQRNRYLTTIMKSGEIHKLAVACQLQPNECSIHDAYTLHASAENTTNERRCGNWP